MSQKNKLIDACRKGHLKTVKYLVENGADIHGNNDYALKGAVGNGHLETVKYLVDNGADIHAENDCALRWSAGSGQQEVVSRKW